MSQVLILLKKSFYQRKNTPINSIFCEILIPTLFLLFAFIIKKSVVNEIVYEDTYNENPVAVGPFCLFCIHECDSLPSGCTTFPYSKELGFQEKYNPFKSCKILNETIIGFIGENSPRITQIKKSIAFGLTTNSEDNMNKFKFDFKEFKDLEKFEVYLNNPLYKNKEEESNMFPGVCVLIDLRLTDNIYNITLRFSDDFDRRNYFNESKIILRPSTETQKNNLSNIIESEFQFRKFVEGGLIYFQFLIADLIIGEETLYDESVTQVFLSPLHRSYKVVDFVFLKNIKSLLQIIIGLGFFWIFFRVINFVGIEKESKIVGIMRLKGMSFCNYWLAWVIEYIIVSILISLPCIFITKYVLMDHVNLGIIFIFYIFHCLNEFSFGIFVAAIFNSTFLSSVFGSSFYFISMLTGIMLNSYEYSFNSLIGFSAIPPISSITIISLIADLEVS